MLPHVLCDTERSMERRSNAYPNVTACAFIFAGGKVYLVEGLEFPNVIQRARGEIRVQRLVMSAMERAKGTYAF